MKGKIKSVIVELKVKVVKHVQADKNRKKIGDENLFRRKTDSANESLGPVKENDNEKDLLTGKKRFFRRKTDIESCKDLSDSALIEVIQHQNREAYRELFRRYQKKLFLYIYHLTRDRDETEDILQNVFTKTYKNIEHFDLDRKFSSWIYRIAHNEAVNFLKRKSKRYTVSWEDITTSKDKLDTASDDEPIEDRWLHQEITKEIDEALKKLPQQYQLVLNLRYFREYSYDQISKILGKPVNTVGTLINRAKHKLLEVVKAGKGRQEK